MANKTVELISKRLCIDALETASSSTSVAMLHGAAVMQQFDVHTFVVGPNCVHACADCNTPVGVLDGVLEQLVR